MENVEKVFEEIAALYAALEEDHTKFVEKGTKAAAQRARKSAGAIKKLITPYKQASMAACKGE